MHQEPASFPDRRVRKSKYRLATACLAILLPFAFFPLPCYAQGIITTVAGGSWEFRGDGKPATDAPLGEIRGIAVDSNGNVFAADGADLSGGNHLVVKISPAGLLTVVAGNGIRGFSGDGGPATSASLLQPPGVAVDVGGNIYIADKFNNRVRKVSPDGIITTVAGSGGTDFEGGGFSGDGGPATSALLWFPLDVAVDTAGNLYIADSLNNRIRKVSLDGIITTVAGSGESLISGSSGDGGPATSAMLNRPEGVVLDSAGNLYITGPSHRIRKVGLDEIITTVVGNGLGGFSGDGGPATEASLNFPTGVAIDRLGNLYIADTLNERIRAVSLDGIITTVAGNGLFKFSGDGSLATSSSLNRPDGVVFDSAGNLYIADRFNHRVRKVSPDGIITTVAGNGFRGFSGDDGLATSASLSVPLGVEVDTADNLYIADSLNNRIRKVSPNGIITTVAGGGPFDPSLGDGGPATSAFLWSPQDVAVDSAGNLYIAEYLSHRIRKVTGGMITTIAGNGNAGFSGDGGPATSAELNSPSGVALDVGGNLYIGDTLNNRIRKVSPGGMITTLAGNGMRNFSGDGGLATSASLGWPEGVSLDGAGNLYIADTLNVRIRKVSPEGIITTVAGGGSPQSLGDGGPATSARLNIPTDMTVDSAGNLYIADRDNDRIRKVVVAVPSFSVSPTSLSFSAPAGTAGVAAQQVAVLGAVAGLTWSAEPSTESGGPWLSVSPASGSTPGTMAVTVDVANLAPGPTGAQ